MLVLVLQMGGECGHGSEEDEVSELHEHHYECISRNANFSPHFASFNHRKICENRIWVHSTSIRKKI